MTYRERREAKAERLRGWAEKRQGSAAKTLESQPELRHDWAFISQPGHIPARARMNAADERAYESLRKAESMGSRADGIESQLAGAIYSDDENAIEALEARIADLEAQRARIKAYNASCRRGARDLSLLDESQKRNLLSEMQHSPYQCEGGKMPGYALTNLSGNIARNRKRLESLRRKAGSL